MKNIVFAVLMSLGSLPVWAQSNAAAGTADFEAERSRLAAERAAGRLDLGAPVREVGNHVEPRDPFLVQHLDRVGVDLLVHRDQHLGPVEFLLAGAFDVRLGVGEGPLHQERLGGGG